MELRIATTSDTPEIVRLARVLFESVGIAPGADWEQALLGPLQERVGEDLVAFVFDDPHHEGRLASFAVGVVHQNLPTPKNLSGRVGYVQWVCTDEAHRGKGLGRRLMTALLDWYASEEVQVVELHSTPMAEALYFSMGFDDSGPKAMRWRSQGL